MRLSKLPFLTKFDDFDYEKLQQRMQKLPLNNGESASAASEQLMQIFNAVESNIVSNNLQFSPESIYSQYASMNKKNQGKDNIGSLCQGCGDELKSKVQCEFCGVVFCKSCCYRKRVIPTLSQPKDPKIQCQTCHQKYVRLLANQKFFQQNALLNKIIDTTNKKLKKLEDQKKKKAQDLQNKLSMKKNAKIREAMILKTKSQQQKKCEQALKKLKDVINLKADRIRERQRQLQQQRITSQKQKQQQQQIQRNRQSIQLTKAENQRARKQIWDHQIIVQNQHKNTQIQISASKKQKQEEERKNIQQEEQSKKLAFTTIRTILSDEQHKKQISELTGIASQIVHHEINTHPQVKRQIQPKIAVAIRKQQPQEQNISFDDILQNNPSPFDQPGERSSIRPESIVFPSRVSNNYSSQIVSPNGRGLTSMRQGLNEQVLQDQQYDYQRKSIPVRQAQDYDRTYSYGEQQKEEPVRTSRIQEDLVSSFQREDQIRSSKNKKQNSGTNSATRESVVDSMEEYSVNNSLHVEKNKVQKVQKRVQPKPFEKQTVNQIRAYTRQQMQQQHKHNVQQQKKQQEKSAVEQKSTQKTDSGSVKTQAELQSTKSEQIMQVLAKRPQPAKQLQINVQDMTINALLSIHVNVLTNQSHLNNQKEKRDSQKITVSQQVKQQFEKASKVWIKEEELSEEQKMDILKKSLLSSSSNVRRHQQDQSQANYTPEPQKCTCSIM